MKILIVNNFLDISQFRKFVEIVKKIINSNLNFQDTEQKIFIVSNNSEMETFLFEYNTPYINAINGKNFDQLDLVIINGNKNIAPWAKQNYQLFILIRMCIRSEKILFLSGNAYLHFIFSFATNFLKKKFITKNKNNQNSINKALIDIGTGDIYEYNWRKNP